MSCGLGRFFNGAIFLASFTTACTTAIVANHVFKQLDEANQKCEILSQQLEAALRSRMINVEDFQGLVRQGENIDTLARITLANQQILHSILNHQRDNNHLQFQITHQMA